MNNKVTIAITANSRWTNFKRDRRTSRRERRRGIQSTFSALPDPGRSDGLARTSRENRACKRRHEQHADRERHQDHDGVHAIQELLFKAHPRWKCLEVSAEKLLE